ncbi:MarR family transcriptional regulator, partial [Inquilinus limosus]
MSIGKMSGRAMDGGAGEGDPLPGSSAEAMKPRPPSLLSPARMGDLNRSRLLQSLFDLGPTSRADLARHIGVNRATITGIVQPLIDDGI